MAELNLNLTVDNNIQANFFIEGTGSGGGGTPGGLANTLQFNDAGALGGIANVTFANGNLSLGPVANVKMTGGQANFFLQTDGTGNLAFRSANSVLAYSTIPRMEFTAATTGINQTFTNANILRYSSNAVCTVFRNGVLIDPTEYIVSGSTLTFTGVLNTGEVIDIPASTSLGIGTDVGGNSGEIQYNHNNTLAASDKMKFDAVTGMVTITGDIVPGVSNVYNLGNATHRWKDVFLSNNSVIIGDTTLSSDNGLKIDGATALVAVNDTLTVGNVEIANLGNFGNLQAANANIPALVSANANIANLVADSANVSNLAVAGNITVADLTATGNITGNIKAGGNIAELMFPNANGVMTSTNRYYISSNGTGAVTSSRDAASTTIIGVTYNNANALSSYPILQARARGTKAAPLPVQVGDQTFGLASFNYTGNGTTLIDGITGWVPSSPLAGQVTALPAAAGGRVSSNVTIATSNAVSNTVNICAQFDSDRSTTLFGNTTVIGNLIYGPRPPPTSSTSTGTAGQIIFDGSFMYYCVATNTWIRAALSTW